MQKEKFKLVNPFEKVTDPFREQKQKQIRAFGDYSFWKYYEKIDVSRIYDGVSHKHTANTRHDTLFCPPEIS